MRPLYLKLTAFGPYKDTEIIDFTKLGDVQLFSISGNTGAGKTTIFDGIAFALYGRASGSDREDNRLLRSDFAEDHVHTSVELVFTIKEKIYRVLRQPGHIKKGNKTKTGEKYELFEITDLQEISIVDRQIVSEIDKKIEELIGLTQDQFKQIVMLPQGEFRKLLTSETENKEAILRRLFKTEHYKYMNEILRQKKSTFEQSYNRVSDQLDQTMKQISSIFPLRENSKLQDVFQAEYYNVQQVLEAMNDEKVYYQHEIEKKNQQYISSYKNHDTALKEYYAAKHINEQFDQLRVKKLHSQELMNKEADIHQLENQLKAAELAQRIEPSEQYVLNYQKQLQEKEIQLKTLTKKEQQASEQLKLVTSQYKKEEEKSEQREKVSIYINQLESYLPIVEQLDSERNEINSLNNQINQQEHKIREDRQLLDRREKEQESLAEKIKELTKQVEKASELNKRLTELRQIGKLLQRLISLQKEESNIQYKYQQTKKAYENSKKQYQEMEQNWINNQAFVLASHLHDGVECPVCGSTAHPKKASMEKQPITKEALESLQNQMEEKNHSWQEQQVALSSNKSSLNEVFTELNEWGVLLDEPSKTFNEIVQEGKQLAEKEKEIEQAKEKRNQYEERLEQQKQEDKENKEAFEHLKQKYQDLFALIQTKQASHTEKKRQVPEEFHQLSELKANLRNQKQQKQEMDQAWKDIQQQYQQITQWHLEIRSEVKNYQKQITELNKQVEKANKTFEQKVSEAGFTLGTYHEAKLEENIYVEHKQQVEMYNQEKQQLDSQIKELEATLAKEEKQDLGYLEERLRDLKRDFEQNLNQLNTLKKYNQEIYSIKDRMEVLHNEVAETENNLMVITEIYDVLRGQNQKKVSFERYLQMEYLEQIIEAANYRLKDLSNGQFYLTRSDRQESHGRQSGLALDVYDTYTGQTRDVKTLSGGEKFNASLCLALGMSDVIQSFQGNVMIQTMFIDEGFGSLDEESLTKAIDTLVQLQKSGRLIGVISHVQELKDILPATIEVKKTKEGYSHTNLIVK
ncbi:MULTISPECIES: SMC family ATPase [Oceanobacillus]|uniref:Nuclease SbcCD subunit C n=1 Tax=Oceanobacillus kimchii TaxID=746691 RepID=A0ABQ5TME3_9BACI|nr:MULTISPECIES: SMC family ATPase [Oceanobacillus]MBT2600752.1 SMC family ATPase [Oceanobacillus sp. ISL-74]MBT2650851.1 SMC family ATPase [Oceanobacillus sp. ISL-73]MCT1575507.1 SMC family ATPase [Oceanobacillus kimchii]MCT2137138.1 SMC family ATPase [Oceanobacillus kimchii]OEH55324.1 exonuclease [Oceanobacillus sp. E9]